MSIVGFISYCPLAIAGAIIVIRIKIMFQLLSTFKNPLWQYAMHDFKHFFNLVLKIRKTNFAVALIHLHNGFEYHTQPPEVDVIDLIHVYEDDFRT